MFMLKRVHNDGYGFYLSRAAHDNNITFLFCIVSFRYFQGPDNDLQYWGLDYPPLTALVSWGYGVLAGAVVPQLVALHSSRGHESVEGKREALDCSVWVCHMVVMVVV